MKSKRSAKLIKPRFSGLHMVSENEKSISSAVCSVVSGFSYTSFRW
nr:MAG TPA: hypothetical protein [Caudoviricetes sp.]